MTVLRDGCADGDEAMHDFFMDAVFPSRGFEVVSCADWQSRAGRRPGRALFAGGAAATGPSDRFFGASNPPRYPR